METCGIAGAVCGTGAATAATCAEAVTASAAARTGAETAAAATAATGAALAPETAALTAACVLAVTAVASWSTLLGTELSARAQTGATSAYVRITAVSAKAPHGPHDLPT